MFKNLLKTRIFDGYPVDFVLARIRGRGYCAPGADAGAVATRKELDREYAWIFGLLDGKTRKIFMPFFSLFEIERLVAGLRMDRAGESTQIPQVLADSLLSKSARSLLVSQRDHAEKIRAITLLLELTPDIRDRMERLLADESWTNLEASLQESCLEWAARTSRRKGLDYFFKARIDMRNLQTIHKAVRWKSEQPPPLLDGGSVPLRSLARLYDARNLESLEGFARRRLAQRSTGNLENDLIHGLAVQLHRWGRYEGGLTMILSHLWGQYAGLREKTGEKRGYGEVA